MHPATFSDPPLNLSPKLSVHFRQRAHPPLFVDIAKLSTDGVESSLDRDCFSDYPEVHQVVGCDGFVGRYWAGELALGEWNGGLTIVLIVRVMMMVMYKEQVLDLCC